MGESLLSDGERLLQAMLQGISIENHDMTLRLGGVDVAEGFSLRMGSRCTLQLPNKWCKKFSGFLICAVLPHTFSGVKINITSMKHVIRSSPNERLWKKDENEKFDTDPWIRNAWWVRKYNPHTFEIAAGKYTLMWYVSFGSLRNTTWWDETYKDLSFNIEDTNKKCSGFGVRLVDKKNINGETPTSSIDYSRYAPKLRIEDDKSSALIISLSLQEPDPFYF
ncbi:hypothetical protein QVD17_02654 [Tagetes erecta]|uniref:Uncharacterized protein n=1 Tax=Tagetes erecta TaxID=13708 RepID=A0AAD8LG26_TARER|nr:hypothetical protein QVD17_02654 [Tagetes erecta]